MELLCCGVGDGGFRMASLKCALLIPDSQWSERRESSTRIINEVLVNPMVLAVGGDESRIDERLLALVPVAMILAIHEIA